MRFGLSCLIASSLTNSWAASVPTLVSQETDASISYLSMIFGVVDGVLHGSGSQITGQLFRLLSTILLCCAGVLWTYVTFVGVLNTASEGQFLGQRWSSMWIPIRVMTGFCLLIPKGLTGYSLIQVMLMSVIVQGVGAANLAFRKTLDYVGAGGTIVESVRFFKARETGPQETSQVEKDVHYYLLEQAAQVLKSEVCMMVSHQILPRDSSQQGLSTPVDFSRKMRLGANIKSGVSGKRLVEFPSTATQERIGFIEWAPSNNARDLLSQGQHYDLRQAAIELLVINLLPVAQRLALKIHSTPAPMSQAQSANSPIAFLEGEDFSLVKVVHSTISMLNLAHREEIVRKERESQTTLESKQDEMKAAGWITAGNWYRLLARVNQRHAELGISTLKDTIHSTCENQYLVYEQLSEQQQKANFANCLQALDEFTEKEKNRLMNYHQASWLTHPTVSDSTRNSFDQWLLDPFQANSQAFQQRMQAVLDKERDPIIALSLIGQELLKAVERTWKKLYQGDLRILGLFAESHERGEWHPAISRQLQRALGDFLKCLALLPILMTWMLLNFTLGSILVYYVPFIPFLVFFFRALNWFGSVIIAIVAAPCVAVGVMSPEGHPVFGFAEQAVRRLVDLFLCPLLMVFGLVFGMIVCTVIFELFNYGYRIVMLDMPEFQGILSAISQIAMTTLYTVVAISIITRCFALIHELPAKTLSWLGWPTEGYNDADVFSQIRGGIEQRLGGVGQSVTGQLVGKTEPTQTGSRDNPYDTTVYGGHR